MAMEAIAGLIMVAREANDRAQAQALAKRLVALMESNPAAVPPMAHYCLGSLHALREKYPHALREYRLYLKRLDGDARPSDFVRGWLAVALVLVAQNRFWLADRILSGLRVRFAADDLESHSGMAAFLKGRIAELQERWEDAYAHYAEADGEFLGRRHWYNHLHVLYAFARLERHRRNFSQAKRYLALLERVASGAEFGKLRVEIEKERARIASEQVDLVLDSDRGVVLTREFKRPRSLKKQFVLLEILQALTEAHDRKGGDEVRGLTKAQLIERVWHERYRPEAHDNKLYYNINRLRKLIEPDMKRPRYLLNFKEGYRLAPDLRVQWTKSTAEISMESTNEGNQRR
jgi:two-component system phosphate regulon response regulator OmpR